MDKTLVILKPHAVERGLTGRILSRLEDMGLSIAQTRVLYESSEFWSRFYPSDSEWFRNAGGKTLESCKKAGIDVVRELGTDDPLKIGKMIKHWLVEHMSSGRAIAALLEGNEAGRKVRLACGATLPNKAEPGTIRFDFSSDSPALANREKRPVFNLIHASDPEEEGALSHEIGLVFPDYAESRCSI